MAQRPAGLGGTVKRVLLVAHFYPPMGGGGVTRTLGFVRHLREFAFEPVVLTGSGTSGWVSDPELSEAVADVETVRAGTTRSPAGRLRSTGARRSGWQRALARASAWLMIPDSYARWRGAAVKAGLARLRQGDIHALYSTSPPDTDHRVALELKHATGLPWVADFRDPWIGLGYREPPTPWHRLAHEEQLREVLAGADRVAAATEATAQWLRAHAGPRVRPQVTVIPNGFEEDDWRRVRPREFQHFTVVHAGRLSEDRNLESFLQGLKIFLSRDEERRGHTRCLLLGPHDGAEEARVARHGLREVVRFEGQLPHREVLAAEAGAHVLLLIKHRSERMRGLVPGKLYEYMGAGRPVLAVVGEGPAAELVRGLGLGWVAPPEAPARIAEALEAAWQGRCAPRHAPSDRSQFTRRALCARLAALLEDLT